MPPRRSTISDANKRRDYVVFEAIYLDLVDKYLPFLSDSNKPLISNLRVFSIDSTTISLFQPIFECVGRIANSGKRKGGIKSHQKLDMQAGIPVAVYHSHAREHDSITINYLINGINRRYTLLPALKTMPKKNCFTNMI